MAAVEVIAAADREADHQVDGLALVELLDALAVGGLCEYEGEGGEPITVHAELRSRFSGAILCGACAGCRSTRAERTCGGATRARSRGTHSALMFAALMIGVHSSTSAFISLAR